MENNNIKYQKRLEKVRAKQIEKEKRTETAARKNADGNNVARKNTAGNDRLTFQKATNGWKKTRDFKDLLISKEEFDMQWKIIRASQAYFTEEEWKNVPLRTLEEKFSNCIDEFYDNLPDNEEELFQDAFSRFMAYINFMQIKYGHKTVFNNLILTYANEIYNEKLHLFTKQWEKSL